MAREYQEKNNIPISVMTKMSDVKNRRRLWIIGFFLLTFACVIISGPFANAASVESNNETVFPIGTVGAIQDALVEIQSEKIDLDISLSEIRDETKVSREEIELLNEEILLLDKEYGYQSELVALYQSGVEALRTQISTVQEEKEHQEQILKIILRSIEESQKITFWQVIFDSSSIKDLFSRIDIITSVITEQKNQLNQYEETQEKLYDMRYQLQELETEYTVSLNELTQQKEQLENRNNYLEERLAELSAAESEIQEMLVFYAPPAASGAWTEALTEEQIVAFLSQAAIELNASSLSDEEIEQRLGILEAGLSLVGKVPYFWGGRVYTPGWCDTWNTLQPIKHAGCDGYQPLGEYFPYGLDCGGFVFWAALTMYGEESWNSPVEWMSGLAATGIFTYANEVEWDNRLPGDMCVNTPITHIGYYLCKAENGEDLYIHSCGRYGVIVSTKSMTGGFDRAATIF